jgi:hypothetical protein
MLTAERSPLGRDTRPPIPIRPVSTTSVLPPTLKALPVTVTELVNVAGALNVSFVGPILPPVGVMFIELAVITPVDVTAPTVNGPVMVSPVLRTYVAWAVLGDIPGFSIGNTWAITGDIKPITRRENSFFIVPL